MLEAGLPVASIIILVALIPRFRDLRAGANPRRRAITGVLVALFFATACAAPSVGPRVAEFVGVQHLDLLVGRLAIVVGAFCAMRGFTNTFGSRGIFLPHRPDLVLLAVVLVVTTLSFVAAEVPRGGDPMVDEDHPPAMTAFVLTFAGYLGWCCLGIVAGWRSWRHHAVGIGGRGLFLITLAGVSGLVYALGRVVGELLLLIVGESLAVAVTRQVCMAAGLVTVGFIALGSCWAPVTVASQTLSADLVRRWRLLQLYPLWRDVVAAVPGVRLDVDAALRPELLARDSHWSLYRRVIEILDAQSELGHRRELDPSAADALSLAVERVDPAGIGARLDLDEEAARLAEVARHYRNARDLIGTT